MIEDKIIEDIRMKFYKIRHIPTGLFYQPVKGGFPREKTNLSKTGKVYQKKPTLEHLTHGYKKVVEGETRDKDTSIHLPFIRSEWEIVEFVMVPLEQYREWERIQKKIESEIEDLHK